MKVLIYGFKPYLRWKENISEKIVKKIKNRKGLKKVIFDVKFCKKQFVDAVKKFNPDVIIGLGQHPRGKKIRVERKAVNLKRHDKEPFKRISKKGSKYLSVNLRLKKGKYSWFSYDAGQYVCNYSMYVILTFIKNKGVRFAFVHIPKDYNVSKGVKYVERILQVFRG